MSTVQSDQDRHLADQVMCALEECGLEWTQPCLQLFDVSPPFERLQV